MAGWDVQSTDFNSVSAEVRDYILSTFVAAVGVLDQGWCFHFDYLREPLPPLCAGRFPDPVTQAMDDARVARFNENRVMYGAMTTMILRWTPPKDKERKLAETLGALFTRSTGDGDALYEQRHADFLEGVARFEDSAADVLTLRRLRTVQLRPTGIWFSPLQAHLFQTIYGYGKMLTSHNPWNGMYLDSKLAVADFYAGMTPSLDGKHIAVVGIDDFPHETATGMLQALAGFPVEYRWNTRFILLSRSESDAEMKRHRRKWNQSASSFLSQYLGKQAEGHKASVASMMADDADAAAHEVATGELRYGHFTSVFVFRSSDKDALTSCVRDVRSELAKAGCVGRHERENASEAFLGSLPGVVTMNIRKPLLHTFHLANLLPLTNAWSGSSTCPSPLIGNGEAPPLMRLACAGASAFDFNLHDGDVGHTLIFGATGSGKSVLLAMIAAQWRRYPGARVVVFDKGKSIKALTLGVGGVWRELGFGSMSGFRPLETLGGEGAIPQGERVWIAEWITDICRLNRVEPTAQQRRIITEAVADIAGPGRSRNMMDLQVAIQDQSLKDVLGRYCGDGDYAQLYDDLGGDDHDFGADFICYEAEELHEMKTEAVLPLLFFIFRTIERAATGDPTLILLDEAWSLLAHAVFADKIREWLKTMRKRNVAVVMATQSLSDAIKSNLLDVLIESCPTAIYGANPEAEGPAKEHYEMLGLAPSDIHIISRLRGKRQYYVATGQGRRVVDMMLGPEELRWAGVSDPTTLATLDALRQAHPDDWRSQWEHHNDEAAA